MATGEKLLSALNEEQVGLAVEDPVLLSLKTRRPVDDRVETGNGGIEGTIRVGPEKAKGVTGLDRASHRIRADKDWPTLAVVLLEEDPLIAGTISIVPDADELDDCDVDEESDEQQRENKRSAEYGTSHIRRTT